MHMIASLAALLGLEVESLTERVRNTIIINGLIGLFALIGAGFLLAAGYIAVAAQLGGLYAALIFGGAFIVLALAVYLGALIGSANRKKEIKQRKRSNETGALITTAALTALPVLLKSPLVRTIGLPAAGLAAFLLMRGGSDKDEL